LTRLQRLSASLIVFAYVYIKFIIDFPSIDGEEREGLSRCVSLGLTRAERGEEERGKSRLGEQAEL